MNVWILAAFFAIGALVAYIAFWMGMVGSMLSGLLFAYVVFRTKREPHESMLAGPSEGDTYISDPAAEQLGLVPPMESNFEAAEATMRANQRLMDSLAMIAPDNESGSTGYNHDE